jgi:hypothetical protein
MALNPLAIRVGPGRIYVGVTAPATGSPIALTSGVPATGTEAGLTEGEAIFTYTVSYLEEVADQLLPAVAVFAKGEKAELDFTMKEYGAANLVTAMQQVNLATNNGTTPKTDTLSFGGSDYAVTTICVVLASPIPNTSPQRYTAVVLYKAYQSTALQVGFTKDKSTVMKVKLTGIADASRNDPDMLGQLLIERN